MANYQGLTPIMGEITTMVSNSRPPHDQHIYDYFSTTEKWMRIAVPQLFMDCMEQFKENLTIEIETYLNGSKINHEGLTQEVAAIIQKAVNNTKITISL